MTVSNRGFDRRWPGLDQVVLRDRVFASAADVQAAWFDAIERVDADWFFMVDDDDELPDDYLDVIDRCRASGLPIAYTDELVVDDHASTRRTPGAYSRHAHASDPSMLHHLVLCRTADARAAVSRLPRGHYWPELMLFWELARHDAAYVPAIGYVWNKRATGLHRAWFTGYGVMQSQLWCKEHP